MANSCLSTAAHAALCLPCPKLPGGDAAWPQLVFARPARAHRRLIADHVAAPDVPVARRRRLAVTAMASQEEGAATAVEEVSEGQLQEQEEGQGEIVEESSDNGGEKAEEGDASEAESTTATKLYFGNLPYNCDSAQLAAIVQDYASPEMVEVRFTVLHIQRRWITPARRLRWLWLERTEPDRVWTKLPIHNEKEALAMFEASLLVEVGNGTTTRFWTDRWLQGQSIKYLAPNMFEAVPTRIRNTRTVAEALERNLWGQDIRGARTVQVMHEYCLVWDMVYGYPLQHQVKDRFIWKWSSDGKYSASSAYAAFFHGQEYMRGGKELWKARVPVKCKFFFWLALYRRCWTSERLQRHNMENYGNCALCDQVDEFIDHLLLHCPYSRECWYKILRPAGYQQLLPDTGSSLVDWWLNSRKKIVKGARKGFDSLVILTAWKIWCERNNRVFNGQCVQASTLVGQIQHEGRDWIKAGIKQLARFIEDDESGHRDRFGQVAGRILV